jgi:Domain of unknown function (DUF5655)
MLKTKAPGSRWKCPACKREFGRRNQSHGCAPSGTVSAFFSDRPKEQRHTFDAIERHLAKVGPVLVDAVSVCIMFKRTRTFAEVRSKKRALTLTFLLSRRLAHPKIVKTLAISAHRVAHFINLERSSDVDELVRAWLTESFLESPP